ncbi:hypothetical protein KBA27_01110 [bacterium]|nr:hypothetical protein [bacterium]
MGFNVNGFKLAEKTLKIAIKDSKSVQNSCKDAVSYDFVRVLTDFGKGEKDIQTFYNKDGQMIKRFMIDSGNKKTVESEYFIREKSRIVNRNFLDNNNIERISREKFINFKNGKKGISHSKLTGKYDFDGRVENQVFEELSPKEQRRYLEINSYRNNDGHLKLLNIDGNVTNNFEELHKYDEYLPTTRYSTKDFVDTVKYYAQRNQDVKEPVNVMTQDLNKDFLLGLCSEHNIWINDKDSNKSTLVNTINHEFKHSHQYEIRHDWLNIRNDQNQLMPLKERLYLLHLNMSLLPIKNTIRDLLNDIGKGFKKASLPTIGQALSNKGFKIYENELVERQARKAGFAAEKKYNNMVHKLETFFPNSDSRLFSGKINPTANAPTIKIGLFNDEQKSTQNDVKNKLNNLFNK